MRISQHRCRKESLLASPCFIVDNPESSGHPDHSWPIDWPFSPDLNPRTLIQSYPEGKDERNAEAEKMIKGKDERLDVEGVQWQRIGYVEICLSGQLSYARQWLNYCNGTVNDLN